MGYFIGGLLLGLIAGRLLFGRFSPGRFQQLLQQESVPGGHSEQLARTARRLDSLEECCRRLEKELAAGSERKACRGAGSPEAGWKRERVLTLWEEGQEFNEIIRRTGLSRGEIELILSLQERH